MNLRESSWSVTGPSLMISTSIIAPKRPSAEEGDVLEYDRRTEKEEKRRMIRIRMRILIQKKQMMMMMTMTMI